MDNLKFLQILRQLGFDPVPGYETPLMLLDNNRKLYMRLSESGETVGLIQVLNCDGPNLNLLYDLVLARNKAIEYGVIILTTSKDKIDLGIEKSIDISDLSKLKFEIEEIEYYVSRLESNIIEPYIKQKEQLNTEGFEELRQSDPYISYDNPNIEKLKKFLVNELTVPYGPRLLLIKGKIGIGKRSSIRYALDSMADENGKCWHGYKLKYETQSSLAKVVELYKLFVEQILISELSNIVLIISPIITDFGLLNPFSSKNQILYPALVELSEFIPVILISSGNISCTYASGVFNFKESDDKIFNAAVSKSKFPANEDIIFTSDQHTNLAEPLNTIRVNAFNNEKIKSL